MKILAVVLGLFLSHVSIAALPDPPRKFEALPKPAQAAVKRAYARLLQAQKKKNYYTVLIQASLIVARLDDYRDTLRYEAIARGELGKTEVGCEDGGGSWGSWTRHDGANGIETCRWVARDAGKPCRDGKECSVGLCEFDQAAKPGTCPKYPGSEGCHSWVTNGKPEPMICVD